MSRRRHAGLAAAWAAFAAAVGAVSAQPPSVALWGGVSTGMSSAEVRALYPAAHRPADPAADAGYLTTLAASAPPVRGHATTVLFRFHNDRLFGVRLDVGGLAPGRSAANLRFTRTLIRDASAHAPSYDCADNSYADVALLDCKWLKDDASIRLEYMDVAGQAPRLKILYSPVRDVGSDL